MTFRRWGFGPGPIFADPQAIEDAQLEGQIRTP